MDERQSARMLNITHDCVRHGMFKLCFFFFFVVKMQNFEIELKLFERVLLMDNCRDAVKRLKVWSLLS